MIFQLGGGLQCLAQQHFNMWLGEAGIWTAECWIIGQPALPPELQLSCLMKMPVDNKNNKLNR